MTTLAAYADAYLLPRYENFPRGRYVSLLIVRKTESETIFRTEGSGEDLSKETLRAGLADERLIRRVAISKRKQTAVERRTGRELLREHNRLYASPQNKKGEPCTLNTNAPCERCVDCMLYGFAVGGGGAQKSRVITDDSFSLAPVAQVVETRTFNATFETGTMRLGERISTSINQDEYVRPETHFLDIETLKDVTLGELQYVLGNVLRSTRYGAVVSRMGRVKNTPVALVFSDCELFSNLELTQAVWDRLCPVDGGELPVPLADRQVRAAVEDALDALLPGVASRAPVVVRGAELDAVIAETLALYREPGHVRDLLDAIEAGYRPAA